MLEDEFVDILRKAKKGSGLDDGALAAASGIDPTALGAYLRGEATPPQDGALALGRVLGLDPEKFADSAAVRWHPDIALPTYASAHPQLPQPSNGYLIVLEDGKTAALVDPAGDPQAHVERIRAGPGTLRYLLITHKHKDHCDAAGAVAAAFPEAEVVMHPDDLFAIGPLGARATKIVDGATLPFGRERIVMRHTPGHTDGSSCFLFRDTLFTGDTMFAGSVGAATGDRSTYRDLLASIEAKIFSLPAATVIAPGHGPPSSLAQEREHNPFF
ncbi:MAG: MBL fold metallo-hydrolase [Vulcanimicrobiaceae bacterium]